MSDSHKRILSPFMGVKNEKLGIRLEKNRKIYVGKMKTKFSCNRQGIILQRGMVRRIFRQQRCILQRQ